MVKTLLLLKATIKTARAKHWVTMYTFTLQLNLSDGPYLVIIRLKAFKLDESRSRLLVGHMLP